VCVEISGESIGRLHGMIHSPGNFVGAAHRKVPTSTDRSNLLKLSFVGRLRSHGDYKDWHGFAGATSDNVRKAACGNHRVESAPFATANDKHHDRVATRPVDGDVSVNQANNLGPCVLE
jgi:hypothetical protein